MGKVASSRATASSKKDGRKLFAGGLHARYHGMGGNVARGRRAARAAWLLFFVWALFRPCPLWAQHEETPEELLPEQEQERLENDEVWQEREARAAQRLNLNTADASQLLALGVLNGREVQHFLAYRQLLGPLVSLYELQAVPGFDLRLVRSLLPYVEAGSGLEPSFSLRDYWRKGRHQVLLRYARALPPELAYAGSADRLMVRYRYRFGPYASWGVVMEKDAGEQWFRGAQRAGFDHYGFHLFLRRKQVKSLLLGDYTVNMGQGLIQWHGLSFGKSGSVMQVKREGEVLRPYASAGEFYFFRGAGITVSKRCTEWTAFVSHRFLDAADSSGALTRSGYHRTASEAAKRGATQQYTAGIVARWLLPQGHVSLNALGHRFSKPFIKGDAPYRLYGLEGTSFLNAGVDYAAGWRNVHFYGEAAVDRHGGWALLQGMLASLGHYADVVMVYRKEGVAYQALYANAFGENSAAGNETGLYTGLQLKPGRRWLLMAYADVFRFPWLKYRVNGPSEGFDATVALTWTPDKNTTFSLRYQLQRGAAPDTAAAPGRLRCQLGIPVIPKAVHWQCRLQAGAGAWLMHQQFDARWQQWRFAAGYSWFETADKKAVYLAGQGFPGDNSLARFSGQGWGLQGLVQRKFGKWLTVWGRWHYAAGKQTFQVQLQCNP